MTQFSSNKKGLLTVSNARFIQIKYDDNNNSINIGDNCHSERDKWLNNSIVMCDCTQEAGTCIAPGYV